MKPIQSRELNRAVKVIQRPRILETYLVEDTADRVYHVVTHPKRDPQRARTMCEIEMPHAKPLILDDDRDLPRGRVCLKCRRAMLTVAYDLDSEANDIMDNDAGVAFNRAGDAVEDIIDLDEQEDE